MPKQETPIEWWNDPEVDHTVDTFWIKDAMQTAVGLFWYNHVRNTGKPMPELKLKISEVRGVVTAYGWFEDEA